MIREFTSGWWLVLGAVATAQVPPNPSEPRVFEVVSIKPNSSGAAASDTNTAPGRLSLVNVSPLSLVQRAFGFQAAQIAEAPGWFATERFDVLAVTNSPTPLTDAQRQPFLQAMLTERFGLKFHREMRELRSYSLVAAKDGPKLRAYTGTGGYAMKVDGTRGKMTLLSTKGNIPRLVEILGRWVDRPVSNDTGLAGEYDFTLEWVQDPDTELAGPSLFTALQEQLGLKLESVRRPVETIVIEQVTRPTAN